MVLVSELKLNKGVETGQPWKNDNHVRKNVIFS